jgi:two-component system sensor histidine kinase ComP
MEHVRKHIEESPEIVMYLRQLEQEKLKLSRELHDTALQEQIIALRELDLMLTEPELQQQIELKKRLLRVREQQANSIYVLRNFCQTHYVPRLGDGELRNHIQFLLDHLQLRTNIEVVYHNRWERSLEGERALHTYRILQELLHNTEKHAHATRVELIMEQERECYLIQYKDDGIGMDNADHHVPIKLGMKGVYSRVECLQAKVNVISSKQSGFQFMLRIPLSVPNV